MSRFDQEIIDYDIEPFLKEYFKTYKENRSSYYMTCPYCGKEDKFYIQKQYKYFICFVCEEKGSVYKLIGQMEGIESKEAFKLVHGIKEKRLKYSEVLQVNLVNYCGLYEEDVEFAQVDLSKFPKINELDGSHEAKEYLEYRGIDDEMVKYFDIRFSEESSRIIFPIYFQDKVVGYQGRDITGFQKPKTLSSTNLPTGFILFNYNQLLYNMPDYTVLTEGPIDCVKAYKHNAIALLGNKLSQQQLNLLLRIKTLKRVYIALDPQEIEMRIKLLKELSAFWETFLVPIDPDKDFGMYEPYEIDKILKKSKSVFDFDMKIML